MATLQDAEITGRERGCPLCEFIPAVFSSCRVPVYLLQNFLCSWVTAISVYSTGLRCLWTDIWRTRWINVCLQGSQTNSCCFSISQMFPSCHEQRQSDFMPCTEQVCFFHAAAGQSQRSNCLPHKGVGGAQPSPLFLVPLLYASLKNVSTIKRKKC